MSRRYEHLDGMAGFGFLVNAMFNGGEDAGATFPRSDAEDMSAGARFIPGEVTQCVYAVLLVLADAGRNSHLPLGARAVRADEGGRQVPALRQREHQRRDRRRFLTHLILHSDKIHAADSWIGSAACSRTRQGAFPAWVWC